MFNRTYQKIATRQGIQAFMAEQFYRPARIPDPRPRRVKKPAGPEQLKLDFSVDRPLTDLFDE